MIYSTYMDERLIKACIESGSAATVTKPATEEGYLKMIDAFLEVANK